MDLFEKAVAFALKAHEGQVRKREDTPFILHPAEAAAIAATMTSDREVLAAVMLHDTVEDTDTDIEELRAVFGDRVAQLVAGETEPACEGMSREESWRRRKEHSLLHLRRCGDRAVQIMWLSDKLANMRSFYRMYLAEGSAMWEHFHQRDIRSQAWYYRSVADAVSDFADTPAYQEYIRLTNIVFAEVKDEI